jgi:hypothetical protein
MRPVLTVSTEFFSGTPHTHDVGVRVSSCRISQFEETNPTKDRDDEENHTSLTVGSRIPVRARPRIQGWDGQSAPASEADEQK